MAATSYRRPSVSANGNYGPPQNSQGTSGGAGDFTSRRKQPMLRYDDDDEVDDLPLAPEVPRVARSVSYRKYYPPAATAGTRGGRSFSERTRDLPPDQWELGPHGESMSQPMHEERSGTGGQIVGAVPADGPVTSAPLHPQIDPNTVAAGDNANNNIDSARGSGSHASPLSRSSTVRSGKEQQQQQRRDWANDRSPLQKLEVTLSGISKEEKRARVLEAEMRLKERLARQKIERDRRELASENALRPLPSNKATAQISTTPKETPLMRSMSQQQPKVVDRSPLQEVDRRPEHRRLVSEGSRPVARPEARTAQTSQISGVSLPVGRVQYPTVRGGPEPQYAHPEPSGARQRSASTRNDGPGAHGTYRMVPTQGAARGARDPSSLHGPPVPSSASPLVPEGTNPRRLPMQASQGYVQTQRPVGRQPANPGAVSTQPRAGTLPAVDHMTRTSNAPPIIPGERDHKDYEPIQGTTIHDSQGSMPQSKPKKPSVSFDMPPPTPPPLSEWRNAPIAKLGVSDFEFQHFDVEKSKAWWEGGGAKGRRRSRVLPNDYQKPIPKIPESTRTFQPPLFLKCGPLLRYTGIRREKVEGPDGPMEKESWGGSIMIVTKTSRSTHNVPPMLRVFPQPMDLLPPPPTEVNGEEDGGQLAPEYVDPTAGLMKISRDGRPLYVKPIDHLDEAVDLSLIENDDGIYEQTPSIIEHGSDGTKQPIPANRIHLTDGETAGTYKEIPGIRLHDDPDRDVTFWRFSLEIELSEKEQQRIAYRINQGPAVGFWVPAKGQSMKIAFYTGNGFASASSAVDSPNKLCGPDPLWRDILNEHQTRPFHVMIGGGDQVFNDTVMMESPLFQEWLRIKNTGDKFSAPLSAEFKAELETFLLERYALWFSQGLYSLANSQIPMVNVWNDHELIEGFGSYSEEFMRTPVMTGLGKLAFKYYLLFQHHSLVEETDAEEPSWLLGAHSGPYIREKSRNVFLSLGKHVAFLGLDCRTERTHDEIISEQTCDRIWDRCHNEITKGETKHLIVLSSIPVAYPRVAVIKNLLNSRKSLGKAGLFGGFVNKYGGNVAIFDDHWTAKHHKSERTWLIEDLQDLAAEKSVRVTLLSGDVHLAAIGKFYSNPNLDIPKDMDYRYMPNVISSAIADFPETELVSDVLNRRNRVHHVDSNTDEDMIPIFTHDVDGKTRNNKRLLPRRNWCSIREYQPGTTPPDTPELEMEPVALPAPRPGKLQRTLSLGRGDRPKSGGLFRRLSLRGPPPTKEFHLRDDVPQRPVSMGGGPHPPPETSDSYFPAQPQPQPQRDTDNNFRPGPFHRRPTNLSLKAAKKVAKEGDDGVGAFVNLEGGLAITLNLEVNSKDPSGITVPYKLLVPALRFEEGDEFYDPPATHVAKGWKKWLKMRRKKVRPPTYVDDVPASDEESEPERDEEYDDDEAGDEEEADYEGYPGSDEEEEEEDDHHYSSTPQGHKIIMPDGKKPRKKWFGVI